MQALSNGLFLIYKKPIFSGREDAKKARVGNYSLRQKGWNTSRSPTLPQCWFTGFVKEIARNNIEMEGWAAQGTKSVYCVLSQGVLSQTVAVARWAILRSTIGLKLNIPKIKFCIPCPPSSLTLQDTGQLTFFFCKKTKFQAPQIHHKLGSPWGDLDVWAIETLK